MGADCLLVDTSVLLEATDEGRAQSYQARLLLEQHPRLVFPAQVIREYLVVATRPVQVNGLGLSSGDALANVTELRRVVRLLPEEKPLLPQLLELVEKIPVSGKRVHDAAIVAAALAHHVARIVTLNMQDFRSFTALVEITDPASLAGTGSGPRDSND